MPITQQILGFCRDFVSDGYKLISFIVPALSALGAALRFFEVPVVKDFSYAWALLPLTVWVVIAYFRRWRYSKELEQKQQSRLKIEGPIPIVLPKNATGRALRTFCVKVTNLSTTDTIRGCGVRLIDMKNQLGIHSHERGRYFKKSVENPDVNLNHTFLETFDLAPRDWEYVDLIRYDERGSWNYIKMLYALQGNRDHSVITQCMVRDCPHDLIIRAVSKNGGPLEDLNLRFWVDEQNMLCMEQVDGSR